MVYYQNRRSYNLWWGTDVAFRNRLPLHSLHFQTNLQQRHHCQYNTPPVTCVFPYHRQLHLG